MINYHHSSLEQDTAMSGYSGLTYKEHTMIKVVSFPASSELDKFVTSICPVDQHVHVRSIEVYADSHYTGRFTGLFMEQETTYCNIVRHFAIKGESFYTLEKWEHDNGYRCSMEQITERQFVAYIQSSGLYL